MNYLYAIGLLLFVMVAWIIVQAAANRFAQRHPEFGSARRMGEGCCGKCSGDTCDNSGHH